MTSGTGHCQARTLVKAKGELRTSSSEAIRVVEGVTLAATLVSGFVEGETCGRTFIPTVAVLTLPREVHVHDAVIAEVGNCGVTVAALDLGVFFAGSIAGMTHANECGSKDREQEAQRDFHLCPDPERLHIWSIGKEQGTVLSENCTEWFGMIPPGRTIVIDKRRVV